MSSCVAFIPARSGSKRVPDKNIRRLNGHPLIAYSIAAALDSKVFDAVVVATDSEDYANVARYYGAEVPFLRPKGDSGDTSPDIAWLELALDRLKAEGRNFDFFSILRPTSPFRLPATIQRAWKEFLAHGHADSLRAVEKCSQHPGKMWVRRGGIMYPLLPLSPEAQPWHSSQYASLPEVYVQNASLEIASTQMVRKTHSIAGHIVLPFLTEPMEGFDINQPEDWILAETYLEQNDALLPEVSKEPYPRS
jgi:CMP-N,N'-diacetyllegionaminic acid synthase